MSQLGIHHFIMFPIDIQPNWSESALRTLEKKYIRASPASHSLNTQHQFWSPATTHHSIWRQQSKHRPSKHTRKTANATASPLWSTALSTNLEPCNSYALSNSQLTRNSLLEVIRLEQDRQVNQPAAASYLLTAGVLGDRRAVPCLIKFATVTIAVHGASGLYHLSVKQFLQHAKHLASGVSLEFSVLNIRERRFRKEKATMAEVMAFAIQRGGVKAFIQDKGFTCDVFWSHWRIAQHIRNTKLRAMATRKLSIVCKAKFGNWYPQKRYVLTIPFTKGL